MQLRSGTIVSTMSSSSSSEHSASLESGNGNTSNIPIVSSKPQTSMQNVIRNTSGATPLMASRPFPMYGLPLGYTPLVATTYMGQMPTMYPNPLLNPLFMGMP